MVDLNGGILLCPTQSKGCKLNVCIVGVIGPCIISRPQEVFCQMNHIGEGRCQSRWIECRLDPKVQESMFRTKLGKGLQNPKGVWSPSSRWWHASPPPGWSFGQELEGTASDYNVLQVPRSFPKTKSKTENLIENICLFNWLKDSLHKLCIFWATEWFDREYILRSQHIILRVLLRDRKPVVGNISQCQQLTELHIDGRREDLQVLDGGTEVKPIVCLNGVHLPLPVPRAHRPDKQLFSFFSNRGSQSGLAGALPMVAPLSCLA